MLLPGNPPEILLSVAFISQAAVEEAFFYVSGNLRAFAFDCGLPCGSTVILSGQRGGPAPFSCSTLGTALGFFCCV